MKRVARTGRIDRFDIESGHMVLARLVLPIDAMLAPGTGDEGRGSVQRREREPRIALAAEVTGKFFRGDQVVDLIVEHQRAVVHRAGIKHAGDAQLPGFVEEFGAQERLVPVQQ